MRRAELLSFGMLVIELVVMRLLKGANEGIIWG